MKQSYQGDVNFWRCGANVSARFCCDAIESWNVKPSACSCCDSREISNAMLIDYVWHDALETGSVRASSRGICDQSSGDSRTCAPCVSGCYDCVLRSYELRMNVPANGVTWNRCCRGGCCEKLQGSC